MSDLFTALDLSWPALRVHHHGPWAIREGAGGGKRVSSATTAEADVSEAEITLAEEVHRSLGQTPLFRIQPGNDALDARLAARGYHVVDQTVLRMAPVAQFEPPERQRSFLHWPPLALARDLWEEDGITPERQAVMERVTSPCAAIIGRSKGEVDRASGAAFVACTGEIAMLHALLVIESMRRRGSAHNMMRAAAEWAQDQGAKQLALAVTLGNSNANQLYSSLNMPIVGQYHYRSA